MPLTKFGEFWTIIFSNILLSPFVFFFWDLYYMYARLGLLIQVHKILLICFFFSLLYFSEQLFIQGLEFNKGFWQNIYSNIGLTLWFSSFLNPYSLYSSSGCPKLCLLALQDTENVRFWPGTYWWLLLDWSHKNGKLTLWSSCLLYVDSPSKSVSVHSPVPSKIFSCQCS